MADVARAAGVSGQTVSRVANGRSNVDAATRDRVLVAMREVGYRPNGAARALRTGQFRSLGVIMFALSSYGNVRTLEAIATAAAARGYSLTLLAVEEPTQEAISQAFARLGEAAVDGVVALIESHRVEEAGVELPHGLPLVVIDSDAGFRHPVVDTDQALGAREATEHLLDLGHRTVHHLAGPAYSYAAERRRLAWESVLRERGAEVPEPVEGDWTADAGHAAASALLEAGATAVFCANDHMALGLLRALATAGLTVPRDVSVVGFDDTAEAAHFQPPLTSVHQDFAEVGARSVATLLRLLETGRRDVGAQLVPTTLVVRESSGPAPRR